MNVYISEVYYVNWKALKNSDMYIYPCVKIWSMDTHTHACMITIILQLVEVLLMDCELFY